MNTLTRERQQDAEHERLMKSAKYLHDEFITAARLGNMADKALFAPMVRDWTAEHVQGQPPTKKHQYVGQVLDSTIHDVEQDALLAMLCQLAYSATPQAVLAQEARVLLDNMAWRFSAAHAHGGDTA